MPYVGAGFPFKMVRFGTGICFLMSKRLRHDANRSSIIVGVKCHRKERRVRKIEERENWKCIMGLVGNYDGRKRKADG